MTKDKMTIAKDPKPDLDKFLGTQPAEQKESEKLWPFLLKFNKEEKKRIMDSFNESKYKATYQFLKDAILTNKDFITK
jgi:hypothetical protein